MWWSYCSPQAGLCHYGAVSLDGSPYSLSQDTGHGICHVSTYFLPRQLKGTRLEDWDSFARNSWTHLGRQSANNWNICHFIWCALEPLLMNFEQANVNETWMIPSTKVFWCKHNIDHCSSSMLLVWNRKCHLSLVSLKEVLRNWAKRGSNAGGR